MFSTMITDGFDLLTYRKGRCRRINERRFIQRRAELDGRWVDYLLHDQPVRFLKGNLRLRQVTRLCDGGHQTQVITSRWDLRDIEVAYRMFERWRQENSPLQVYPVHVMTRKSFGLMTRKLSVTESQRSAQFRGTVSRRKPSVASANWAHVA